MLKIIHDGHLKLMFKQLNTLVQAKKDKTGQEKLDSRVVVVVVGVVVVVVGVVVVVVGVVVVVVTTARRSNQR